MALFLWICLGGAAGTGARYLLSSWLSEMTAGTFPLGTLSVNVLGSFLLGAVTHVGFSTQWLSPTTRVVLATGVMGGFTTYSSFNYETLKMVEDGSLGFATAYVGATLVGCLLAGLLGTALGRVLVGG